MLDLATVIQGDKTHGEAFRRSLRFAQHAESLGYTRYWFAEHHNMESVASAATSVLIGFVAGGTSTIRLGAGGIMLPNHSPLVIAEQFGTLASLYPKRIDLGLGRAPGTDPVTSNALRRNLKGDVDSFPDDVVELLNYFGDRDDKAPVKAIPGIETHVPVWLLGSSTYSAQLAAHLGLPFAFASHFAPTHLYQALALYRQLFRPSKYLQSPYAMACVNVIVGDTDEEAAWLSTSFHQLALGIFRRDRKALPPPVADMDLIWTPMEKQGVQQMMHYSFIGSQLSVRRSLEHFVKETGVDEIMISSHLYDVDAKLKSMQRTAEIFSSGC